MSERVIRQTKGFRVGSDRTIIRDKGPRTVLQPAAVLQLNDYVLFGPEPYDWGTVTEVTEFTVTVTRPYLHTSEASYAGASGGLKVIPYLGWEEVTLQRSDPRPLKVLFRTVIPK